MVMAADAHVVSPLFFPGGDIGKLAVCGTVNDLSMSGARPLWLSAGFIIEEGLPLLARAGITPAEDPSRSRKLILDTNLPEVKITVIATGFVGRELQKARAPAQEFRPAVQVPLMPRITAAPTVPATSAPVTVSAQAHAPSREEVATLVPSI